MSLGGPGPRDWSPPEYASGPNRPPIVTATLASAGRPSQGGPRRTRPWAWATLSMLLGSGSVVIGLLEPQRSGLQAGFLVSSIGITAIVLGVRTVRRARWGSATARAFGRGGAILGSVGTGLMAYAVLASSLTAAGVHLPPVSLPVGTGAAVLSPGVLVPRQQADPPVRADTAPGAVGVQPTPAPVTAETVPIDSIGAERTALAQSIGTLDAAMRRYYGSGPYPPSLSTGKSAPERVIAPEGRGLAPVPDGTRILYSAAPDGSSWTVTLVGARFGAVATFSSTTDTIVAG